MPLYCTKLYKAKGTIRKMHRLRQFFIQGCENCSVLFEILLPLKSFRTFLKNFRTEIAKNSFNFYQFNLSVYFYHWIKPSIPVWESEYCVHGFLQSLPLLLYRSKPKEFWEIFDANYGMRVCNSVFTLEKSL